MHKLEAAVAKDAAKVANRAPKPAAPEAAKAGGSSSSSGGQDRMRLNGRKLNKANSLKVFSVLARIETQPRPCPLLVTHALRNELAGLWLGLCQ